MLRLAVTGANGFLGWHVRVLARVLGWPEPVLIDRADLSDESRLAARLDGVDRVLHLAGVNRGNPVDVAAGNVELAAALVRGLRRCATAPATVVFANSVQAGNGTPYGDSKAVAAATLMAARPDLVDLRLPNLYGEHGRAYHNSVVATFCRLLAEGHVPEVQEDRAMALAHVTDAAALLLGVPAGGSWDPELPMLHLGVADLAERLTGWADTYRTGEIPPLADRHDMRLFNTYRSHCFPAHYPIPLARRADERGELVETVRMHGGTGQTFCSTTRPGATRGEHFHLVKMERFVVLRGTAEISLRRVGDDRVLRFAVSGREPVIVDMPTMWAHKLVNTGTEDLVTLFWTNELFDPARPDTYREPVEADRAAPVAVPA
ncbi:MULTISPECIES: polysaccharide biosynthesis C-terminal domain-containing protein [Micromonospora]|uniref:UDP-2-acetamido-2,6-beta-L-arabino-hexul-4-ose reductase n=1 Tax=Micromonospora yangpuensis TaxID=683228 RepID=A0A1C6UGU4_9ACTN|nr:NAD-dependent epimerase/dehydratase family protein [Micromonospora yangpuensis]GGM04658.1 capsular polysaccharide biosynthesis protein Cap8F [Micromonospora yangpuensis]SCL53192.1 UDP-2-acetamido-2,6-beta-L-arabino-hexul-4-ose reductase [Micromonospora yangpuensis]